MKSWIAVAAVVASCSGSRMPTATITVDGHAMKVEVAANGEDRTRGLMHRDHLGADKGMLFVYPDQKVRRFWMKDTRIPLSIAFLDDEGVIVKIRDMQPLSTERTSSISPARYALEVNQGWFGEHDVERGDKVTGLDSLGVEVK